MTQTKQAQYVLHRADTRGEASFGWLHSRHSFSFANYFNPERIQFGALRVLNDDIVQGGAGFGTHPHRDMEIVSIPLAGGLKHEDSMGHGSVIRSGDVQIMSAGTGVLHSEFNASAEDLVNFLQIWILPEKLGIKPRYEQKSFDLSATPGKFVPVVSPATDDGAVWINQAARFSLAHSATTENLEYERLREGNGLYLFVIEGQAEITTNGESLQLGRRDAVGLPDLAPLSVQTQGTAEQPTRLLLIDVPMF